MMRCFLLILITCIVFSCSKDKLTQDLAQYEDLAIQHVKSETLDPSEFELISVSYTYSDLNTSLINEKREAERKWSYSEDVLQIHLEVIDKKLARLKENPELNRLLDVEYTIRCYAMNRLGTRGISDVNVKVIPKEEGQNPTVYITSIK